MTNEEKIKQLEGELENLKAVTLEDIEKVIRDNWDQTKYIEYSRLKAWIILEQGINGGLQAEITQFKESLDKHKGYYEKSLVYIGEYMSCRNCPHDIRNKCQNNDECTGLWSKFIEGDKL